MTQQDNLALCLVMLELEHVLALRLGGLWLCMAALPCPRCSCLCHVGIISANLNGCCDCLQLAELKVYSASLLHGIIR